MATYNGSRYLREQIASLQAQTRKDWLLYIGDDGSTDQTLEMVEQLAREETRIVLLKDEKKGRGACGRFVWLLEQVRERHQIFFFCDQDDVWLPEKIQRLARVIERQNTSTSLLVHCDLAIVDDELRTLHPSFFATKRNDARRRSTQELVSLNTVTGCACAINKALVDLALPMPTTRAFVMHDWWLALVASHRGRIYTVPEALVLYRQHASNTLGAGDARAQRGTKLRLQFIKQRLSRDVSEKRFQHIFRDALGRLRDLDDQYGGLGKSIALLERSRHRDLAQYLVRYRAGGQPITITLTMLLDIVRNNKGRPWA